MNLRSRFVLVPSIALTGAFLLPSALTLAGLGGLPGAERESFAQGAVAPPPPPSDGVTEVARQRYQEGVKAFDAGRYEDARAAFFQAYALKRTPAILLNIGLSELKSNHSEDAGNHFQQFLREAPAATPEQKTTAQNGITEAKKKAGVIVVSVDAVGADLSIDGLTVGKSPMLDPMFVKPGKHTVFAAFQGRSAASVVEVKAGGTVMANLSTAAGGAAPPAPVPGPVPGPAPGPGPVPGPVPGPAPGPAQPPPYQPPQPGPVQPYNPGYPPPNQPPGGAYPGYGGPMQGPGQGPDQVTGTGSFPEWYKKKPLAWVGTGVAGLGFLGGIIFSVGASNASKNANELVTQITAKRSDLSLNPDGRTNVCGDKDSGAGAVPAFAEKCKLLRDNMSLHSTDVALAATSWVLFSAGVIGTGVYTYLDWYKKRGKATALDAPAEKGRAFAPKLMAISPVIGPGQQGLGVVGTF